MSDIDKIFRTNTRKTGIHTLDLCEILEKLNFPNQRTARYRLIKKASEIKQKRSFSSLFTSALSGLQTEGIIWQSLITECKKKRHIFFVFLTFYEWLVDLHWIPFRSHGKHPETRFIMRIAPVLSSTMSYWCRHTESGATRRRREDNSTSTSVQPLT